MGVLNVNSPPSFLNSCNVFFFCFSDAAAGAVEVIFVEEGSLAAVSTDASFSPLLPAESPVTDKVATRLVPCAVVLGSVVVTVRKPLPLLLLPPPPASPLAAVVVAVVATKACVVIAATQRNNNNTVVVVWTEGTNDAFMILVTAGGFVVAAVI